MRITRGGQVIEQHLYLEFVDFSERHVLETGIDLLFQIALVASAGGRPPVGAAHRNIEVAHPLAEAKSAVGHPRQPAAVHRGELSREDSLRLRPAPFPGMAQHAATIMPPPPSPCPVGEID